MEEVVEVVEVVEEVEIEMVELYSPALSVSRPFNFLDTTFVRYWEITISDDVLLTRPSIKMSNTHAHSHDVLFTMTVRCMSAHACLPAILSQHNTVTFKREAL